MTNESYSAGATASASRAKPRKSGNSARSAGEAVKAPGRRAFRPHHATTVPKHMDLEGYSSGKPMTTAMLRNIPNKYSQASLLKEIDSMGFVGSYNFFYLPMDTHNQTNVGYAFINFHQQDDMTRFAQVFTGHHFVMLPSQKIARVSSAHIQGFVENIYHFANCAVTHSHNRHYRPIVIYQGRRRDIADVVAELQWQQGYSMEGGSYQGANGAFFEGPKGLDPSAQEFVPKTASQAAAWLGELPLSERCVTATENWLDDPEDEVRSNDPLGPDPDDAKGSPEEVPPAPEVTPEKVEESLRLARADLQKAVISWLDDGNDPKDEGGNVNDEFCETSSTADGSEAVGGDAALPNQVDNAGSEERPLSPQAAAPPLHEDPGDQAAAPGEELAQLQ
mmetsp:Transcript_25943/g.59963  ORF Transcript_25943/g.59963 Transcript_25943/m.59963 type:complete len:392 (-) Transcript_25943:192-1367(-)